MENAVKTSLRSLCIYYLWDPLLICVITISNLQETALFTSQEDSRFFLLSMFVI
jgi:hypothetical protein